MRILPLIGVSALLALSACGDDASDTSSTDAPSVTAAVAATDAPSAAQPAAAITPIVICYDTSNDIPDYAFAYRNDAETAVALPAGASIAFETEDADVPLAPTLFAPGLVSPALWLSAPDYQGYPGWTIEGPDGESRTAVPDDTTPECTPELLKPTTTDTRTPAIELTSITPSADGQTATVAFEVTGVDTSVCPDGLQAETPSITWSDGTDTAEGSTWERTVTTGTTGDGSFDGGVFVSATVFDRCSGAGEVTEIWPGGDFEALFTGTGYCIVQQDGELVALVQGESSDCPTLPFTGGTKVRPG